MIAKHLHTAKNVTGNMAEAAARRAEEAGRQGDNKEARKRNQQARDFGALAVKIDTLMREAVELMAR